MIGATYPDGTVSILDMGGPVSGPGCPVGRTDGLEPGDPVSALWASFPEAIDPETCDRTVSAAARFMAPFTARGPAAGDQLMVEHAAVADPDLLQRAVAMLHAANGAWWRLDVDGVRFKLLRYRAGHGVGEHRDLLPWSMGRKMSMSMQLSRPGSYDGGRLEVSDGRGGWRQASSAQGSAVVFPAWTPHRVGSVTAGERWSLVVWGYGPSIR